MKSKVNSRAILEDIEIGGSAEVTENIENDIKVDENEELANFKLEYVIASGLEIIPLSWKKNTNIEDSKV